MDQISIITSILQLIPALVKGAEGAVDSFNELVGILKKVNTTQDELNAAIIKRDAILNRIVDKTN